MDARKPLENNQGGFGDLHTPNTPKRPPKSHDMGSEFQLEGVDQRTKAARRWRTLFSQFVNAHKPAGGPNVMHRWAAKQAATTTLAIERIETDLLNGRSVDGAVLVRLQRRLDRYLFTLGLAPQFENDNEDKDSTAALKRLRNWNKTTENKP